MRRYAIHYADKNAILTEIGKGKTVHDIHTNQLSGRPDNAIFIDEAVKVMDAGLTEAEFVRLLDRGVKIEPRADKPKALYDTPGTDPLYNQPFPQTGTNLTNGNLPYAAGHTSPPFRTEEYQAFGGGVANFTRTNNYELGTITGGKIINPAFYRCGIVDLWGKGLTGAGVKVCVVDTGYSGLIAHKALTISGSYNSMNPGGVESVTTGHAAGVISLIAGRNQASSGLIGGAYDCQIYSANFNDPAASISWGLSQGCEVFNLSFETGADVYLREAIRLAISMGAAVVVAAGNGSALEPMQQLCGIPDVVNVGSTMGGGVLVQTDVFYAKSIQPRDGRTLTRAHPNNALIAYFNPNNPGAATEGTGTDGLAYYKIEGGTSFAAPLECALIAQYRSYYKTYFAKSATAYSMSKLITDNQRTFTNLGVTVGVPQSAWFKN